ncbi:MAG TPA: hypothetical protein VF193_06095, partial [Steroidobacter sp.]
SVEKNTSEVYVGTSPITGASGEGSPLFVINLCASIAPIDTSGNNIPGLENYKLYQVSRVEDGRRRHRLRLGFFTSESHAESVLTIVRQQYPTAFTTCLCDEDKRFARGYVPAAKPAMSVVNGSGPAKAAAAPQARAQAPSTPTVAKASTQIRPSTSAPSADRPAASRTLTPAEPEVVELTWAPEPTAKAQAVAANTAAPKQSALPPGAGLDEIEWHGQQSEPSPSDTQRRPALKTTAQTSIPQVASTAKAATAPGTAAAPKPANSVSHAAKGVRTRTPELSLSEPPPPPKAKPVTHTGPFHVGRGVHIEDVGITLQSEPPSPPPAQAHKPAAAAKPSAIAPKPAQPKPAPATATVAKATSPAAAASSTSRPTVTSQPVLSTPPVNRPDLPAPELDSTQTIRALTSEELDDDQKEKWYAVQLAVSEQPVNLEAMPRLDIFEAYRLYSVATAGSGKIVHSLRLGFFKEDVSAEAVAGYLKTFFNSPTVMRVSIAEYQRFRDPPKRAEPRREAQVVELSSARNTRSQVPTVTMEVPTPRVDTSPTGAFKVDATDLSERAPKSAAKTSGLATKRSSATSTRGRAGSAAKPRRKSLSEELLEEARQVELSESGIRKLPKSDSLLSRLVGKLTK